jgi:hypothetical protein
MTQKNANFYKTLAFSTTEKWTLLRSELSIVVQICNPRICEAEVVRVCV